MLDAARAVDNERRRHLEPATFLGKTLSYQHPRDPSSFGMVSISFDADMLRGLNARSSSAGTWKISDDVLCMTFFKRDWSNMCFYLAPDADSGSGEVTVVFKDSAQKVKASLK